MPFQGKFERALKEMEALKRSEAAAREKASRIRAAAKESQEALKAAAAQVNQKDSVEELYQNAKNEVHKLNLALGIIRPYKDKAERLEKRNKSLSAKIKNLEQTPSVKAKEVKKLSQKKPVQKKPVAKKTINTPKSAKGESNKNTKSKSTPVKKAPATKAPASSAKKAPVKKAPTKKTEAPAPKRQSAKSKKEETLARIKAKAGEVDFKRIGVSSAKQKDDLKKIKGVGPYLEEKLNSVGIFTFDQISKFTPKIEDKVNEVIEFFPGRVKRDKWRQQATALLKAKKKK
mgnify:CR=1 FL=1